MQVQQTEVSMCLNEALKVIANAGDRGARMTDRVIVHLYQRLEAYRKIATLRPEVVAFALAMERRLQEKDQDRVASWKHKQAKAISIDLVSKAMRLDMDCIKMARPELRKHAVDVGNFAMFIADVAGELEFCDAEMTLHLRDLDEAVSHPLHSLERDGERP